MSDEKELKPLDGADYIRPFAEDDRDIIEQLVGQGFMESLTKANNWGEWDTRDNSQQSTKSLAP